MPSSQFNTATLGGKPVQDPPPGVVGVNRMSLHTGAARAGMGEFLLARSDYDALVKDNPTATAELALDGFPGEGVKLKVLIAGAVPVSVAAGDDRSLDLVKVVVRDRRLTKTASVNKAYNAQRQGFPYSGTDPLYYASTLNAGSEWTWDQVCGGVGLPAPPAAPAWKPRNLVLDGVPANRAQDFVAAALYLVVGYDWQADAVTLDAPGAMNAANTALLKKAVVFSTAGGKALRNPKRLPASFDVTFGAFDPTASDPFATRYYVKNVPTNTGQAGYVPPLHVGGYVAVQLGAWVEAAVLDAVAADVAARALAFWNVEPRQLEIPGIWPFKPDGAVRGVQWVTDAGGARTVLRLNNDRDFNPLEEMRRASDAASNTLVVGLGNFSADLDAGTGTRYVRGSADRGARVKLGGPIASAGAKYDGVVMKPPTADVSAAGDAAAADVGTVFGSTVLVIDLNEIGRANHSHLNHSDTYHHAQFLCTNDAGTDVYTIQAAPGPGVWFEVDLTQTGGTNGDDSHAPSYTYDVVATSNGETLGTAVAVDWLTEFGSVTPATEGVAYYDAAGFLHLARCDNHYDVTGCG